MTKAHVPGNRVEPPDEAGATSLPGGAGLKVSAEGGAKSDNAHPGDSGLSAVRCAKWNAEQVTLLVVGLLLAVAIVVAALILSKNL